MGEIRHASEGRVEGVIRGRGWFSACSKGIVLYILPPNHVFTQLFSSIIYIDRLA